MLRSMYVTDYTELVLVFLVLPELLVLVLDPPDLNVFPHIFRTLALTPKERKTEIP